MKKKKYHRPVLKSVPINLGVFGDYGSTPGGNGGNHGHHHGDWQWWCGWW